MVTDGDTKARADLELPLSGHIFSVGARTFNSSIETSFVMIIADDSSEVHVSTHRAVVRSLLTWVAIVGPTKRPCSKLSLCSNQLVFLLYSIPRLFLGTFSPDLLGVVSKVCVSWLLLSVGFICPSEGLAHHEDVVSLSERVAEVRNRL